MTKMIPNHLGGSLVDLWRFLGGPWDLGGGLEAFGALDRFLEGRGCTTWSVFDPTWKAV